MTEIEIECLATALPEFITVDLANATKNTSVHVKDLVMPEGIKVVTHGRPNQTVVSVVEPEPEVIAAPVVVEDKKKGKGKK
jgi:large subunit ribosomal protein L25